MKNLVFLLPFLLLGTSCAFSQTELDLRPSQTMHLIGKGPGQEAVINPYAGKKSAMIVRNMGKDTFDIRIQQKGKIIKTVAVGPGKTEEFILEPTYEFYIDGYDKMKSKAWIDFREL